MLLRRFALPALLTAALLALFAVPLAAGAKPHKTTVVVSFKLPAFHGSVKSKDDACVGGRTVKMYRKKAGSPVTKLGTDRTNAKGRWQIKVGDGKHLKKGSYYATVVATGSCRGGKSNVLPIA